MSYPQELVRARHSTLQRKLLALESSLVVSLSNLRLSGRSCAQAQNPPILHRKELFIAPDHPLRKKFVALTKQEEKAGLLLDVTTIGTREGWARALANAGVKLSGHRVVRIGRSQ